MYSKPCQGVLPHFTNEAVVLKQAQQIRRLKLPVTFHTLVVVLILSQQDYGNGHYSVVVSSPDPSSGGTGFDSQQRHSTCSGLTKPAIPPKLAIWYQL